MPLDRDDPWLTHVPLLHRILAGGEPVSAYPRVPHGDAIHGSCAYWEPLYYLLNTILGWRDLGRGLAWWYTNGRPVEDPRLALMQAIWDTDGQLAYFAAWAFRADRTGFSLEDAASTSAFPDENWWRDFRRMGRRYRSDPFYGGTNPLHLGHSHFDFRSGTDIAPAALHLDPTTRQAVLVTRDFTTWREELATAGRGLPPLPDQRSWHVDVFEKRVGWLGNYRRSRVTGRWFAGSHSVHMVGQ
jgi:hypothetical protein